MKKLWLPVLVALLLVGCSTDRTLDTLIPRDALAVVLLDHPSLAPQVVGTAGGIPWAALETGKPWAAAALPASPPGFLLAVALADKPTAWSEVERWAHERGGFAAVRLGSYAVLSTPGLPEPTVLDPDRRFDLSRVRAGGDPVALYIDMKNILDEADFPLALKPVFGTLPWASKNLSGLRIGFAPKDGGFEVRLASDWKAESETARALRGWQVPADPASWSGLIPSEGVGVVASLSPAAWQSASLVDKSVAPRWSALSPLLGPRLAAGLQLEASGAASWSLTLETRDPQAVRQALKTWVASGDLQKNFPRWALDADTPLIYRDVPDEQGRVKAVVTLGASEVQVGYGRDRVVLTGGPRASAHAASVHQPLPSAAPWVGQAPPGASALAAGSLDGLAARAALRVLADANVELRLWVSGPEAQAWQERLPQALLGWLSGEGGWTRWEP